MSDALKEDMITTLIVLGAFSGMATTFMIGGIIAAKRPVGEFRPDEDLARFFSKKKAKAVRNRSRLKKLVPAPSH